MSEIADLLLELVAIPSVSGGEGEVARFAADRLASAGIDVERIEDSVLARLDLGRGPRLLLNSHLDTVPVGEGWTREPYPARWDGERLFGRGANDAKASVAALMQALLELAEEPRPAGARGEVWLALTACEETTNAGMAAVLERLGPPDGAVTGEPTGLEVARAQVGLAVLAAEWTGRSCHAAHAARVEHENALFAAAREIVATAPWLELAGRHPLLGASTIVATVLRAGERHNVVPDRAEALFDARLAPPHGAREAAELVASRLPSARVRVRSERLRPVETAEDHPLVRAALACAGRERAAGSSTLSDMALLAGIPAVKCGPGESSRSHTPDEFVMLGELERGKSFYARLVPTALEALASASQPAP